MKRVQIFAAAFGLASVSVFVGSFVLFGFLNPEYDVFGDPISKLGSRGQPYAFCWNVFGFATVGLLLAAFGWLFGLCKNDRVLGACLVVAGLGFALAAIPTDFADAHSSLSKAHFVSICLSLAGYCFGLARLTSSRSTKSERHTAYAVIALTIIPVVCVAEEVSAEPVAHRVILIVVLAWVVATSFRLLGQDEPGEGVGQEGVG